MQWRRRWRRWRRPIGIHRRRTWLASIWTLLFKWILKYNQAIVLSFILRVSFGWLVIYYTGRGVEHKNNNNTTCGGWASAVCIIDIIITVIVIFEMRYAEQCALHWLGDIRTRNRLHIFPLAHYWIFSLGSLSMRSYSNDSPERLSYLR